MSALDDIREGLIADIRQAELYLKEARERIGAQEHLVELAQARLIAHDAAVAAMGNGTAAALAPEPRRQRRNIKDEVERLLDDVPRTIDGIAASIGKVRSSAVNEALGKLVTEQKAREHGSGTFVAFSVVSGVAVPAGVPEGERGARRDEAAQ